MQRYSIAAQALARAPANTALPGAGDKMRTHMIMFGNRTYAGKNRKRSGKKNNYSSGYSVHEQRETHKEVSSDEEGIDPEKWTGNQRVLHFGPMGSRDPYYYFYPKGWDTLYPAYFGFFPYRTKTYRGSTPIVSLAAFGVFFCIGGGVMTFLGFQYFTREKLHPLQVAGPVIAGLGVVCLLIGFCWWFATLHLFSEHLRHTQPHHAPPRRKVVEKSFEKERITFGPGPKKKVKHEMVLTPPPVPAVMSNRYTDVELYNPESEMKLYPPNFPAPQGLTPAMSSYYIGSPYNTLSSYHSAAGSVYENKEAGTMLSGTSTEYHLASRPEKVEDPGNALQKMSQRYRDTKYDKKEYFSNPYIHG